MQTMIFAVVDSDNLKSTTKIETHFDPQIGGLPYIMSKFRFFLYNYGVPFDEIDEYLSNEFLEDVDFEEDNKEELIKHKENSDPDSLNKFIDQFTQNPDFQKRVFKIFLRGMEDD